MDHETEARYSQTILTAFEQAIGGESRPNYTLRLYVTGTTPRSIRAIANLRKICEEHLQGRYDLEVIDLYQQPHLAEGDQVVAAPTLIKMFPAPLKRIIGDMSNTTQVLVGLDLLHAAEGRRGE
jgi:circadian clock protein KaiB